MKSRKKSSKPKKIQLPGPHASYAELADFFDRHDGVELLEQGIMEINPDRKDLDRMRLEWRRKARPWRPVADGGGRFLLFLSLAVRI